MAQPEPRPDGWPQTGPRLQHHYPLTPQIAAAARNVRSPKFGYRLIADELHELGIRPARTGSAGCVHSSRSTLRSPNARGYPASPARPSTTAGSSGSSQPRHQIRCGSPTSLLVSIGRAGACADNSVMESWFALLQRNLMDRQRGGPGRNYAWRLFTWTKRIYHRNPATPPGKADTDRV